MNTRSLIIRLLENSIDKSQDYIDLHSTLHLIRKSVSLLAGYWILLLGFVTFSSILSYSYVLFLLETLNGYQASFVTILVVLLVTLYCRHVGLQYVKTNKKLSRAFWQKRACLVNDITPVSTHESFLLDSKKDEHFLFTLGDRNKVEWLFKGTYRGQYYQFDYVILKHDFWYDTGMGEPEFSERNTVTRYGILVLSDSLFDIRNTCISTDTNFLPYSLEIPLDGLDEYTYTGITVSTDTPAGVTQFVNKFRKHKDDHGALTLGHIRSYLIEALVDVNFEGSLCMTFQDSIEEYLEGPDLLAAFGPTEHNKSVDIHLAEVKYEMYPVSTSLKYLENILRFGNLNKQNVLRAVK